MAALRFLSSRSVFAAPRAALVSHGKVNLLLGASCSLATTARRAFSASSSTAAGGAGEPIKKLTVFGAGLMGSGIVQVRLFLSPLALSGSTMH